MATRTTLELLEDIKKKVPMAHGGCPIVVCLGDMDSLVVETIFLELAGEGKIQNIKVVLVEEHDLDDELVWISTAIHSNTHDLKQNTKQQFGKDSRNLDQILEFIKESLKTCSNKL